MVRSVHKWFICNLRTGLLREDAERRRGVEPVDPRVLARDEFRTVVLRVIFLPALTGKDTKSYFQGGGRGGGE